MCVIFACDEQKPDVDTLKKSWERNSDGAGIAWPNHEKKAVQWKKGIMVFDELVAELEKLTTLPALIHVRNTTVGGTSKGLTHPFPLVDGVPISLEGTAPGVLMHNGTWHGWKHGLKELVLNSGGKIKLNSFVWSDTRALTMVMHYLGWGYLDIGDVGGQKDRIAILQYDSKEPWIWRVGEWVERPGYEMSNDHFIDSVKMVVRVGGSGGGGVSSNSSSYATPLPEEVKKAIEQARKNCNSAQGDGEEPDFFGASLLGGKTESIKTLSPNAISELLLRLRVHALKGHLIGFPTLST